MDSTLPIGYGTAANIRVGIALGEGNIEQAKMSCKVVLYCTAFVCLLVSCTALALRNVIGYMFTTDRDVIALLSKIMLLFAPLHLCDGINTACSGILRGTGRQKIGAFTNVLGYYLIGIPVGLSLMFLTKLGVMGLWIGMLCPMLLQTGIHIPYIFCMNWHKVGEEAKIRAGVKPVKVPDSRSSKKDILKSEYGGTTMSDSSFIASLTPGEDPTKKQELKDDLPMETTNVVGEILSTKQLIVRRGLAFFLCISLLMIGIAIKLITTKKVTQDLTSLD